MQRAAPPQLRQDEDVLDTWFSSALWPFATLGWPDQTDDLRGVLSRARELDGARDHLPLGCSNDHVRTRARSTTFPFEDVIIHSTVLAPDGRRMSKSLGTGIDPLEVSSTLHGADATRYGLCKMSSTQDVRFSYGTIEEGRKLANKLWNVSRLILSSRAPEDVVPLTRAPQRSRSGGSSRVSQPRRGEIDANLATYDFSAVAQQLYRLTFRRLLRLVRRGDQAADCTRGIEDTCATALLVALERLLALLASL